MSIDIKDNNTIINQLKKNISEKKELIVNYEENEIYELAYLIKWQIIEETIKEIAKTQRKSNLFNNLNDWIQYLNSESKTKPKNINSFSIDSDSIPTIGLILQYFQKSKMFNLNELLDSKEKYRGRRNAIAHRFSKFRNKSVYMEYSKKIDLAISELIKALENKWFSLIQNSIL